MAVTPDTGLSLEAIAGLRASVTELHDTVSQLIPALSANSEALLHSKTAAQPKNTPGATGTATGKKAGSVVGSLLGGPLIGPILAAVRALQGGAKQAGSPTPTDKGEKSGSIPALLQSILDVVKGIREGIKGGAGKATTPAGKAAAAAPGKVAPGGAGKAAPAAAGGKAAGLGGAAKAAGGAALGVASAVGGAALGAVTGAIDMIFKVVSALQEFVQAIAPGVMLQFNQAMRDVYATIGSAFIPIFQVLTGVFRKVGGIILPLMQQLRPVIDQLAKAIGAELVSGIRLAVAVFQLLLPVIQLVVDVYAAFAEMINVVKDVLMVLVQTFADLGSALMESLGFSRGDFKDALNNMVDGFKQAVKHLILFAGAVLKFFGMTTALNSMISNFKKLADEEAHPKSGLKAAPTNVGMRGAADIAKSLATAAAGALGAGANAPKTQEQMWTSIAEGLQETAENGKTLQDLVQDIRNAVVQGVKDEAKSYLPSLPQMADALSLGTFGVGMKVGKAIFGD